MKSKMNAKHHKAHKRATKTGETAEKTQPSGIDESTHPGAPFAKMLLPLRAAGGIYADAAAAVEGFFLTSKVLESAGNDLMRLVVKLGQVMFREQRRKRNERQRKLCSHGFPRGRCRYSTKHNEQ